MRGAALPAGAPAALLLAALVGLAGPADPARATPADPAPGGAAQPAPEASWRAEFDAICGRTQDAMAIPTAELRALVERADALLPRLAALEPTQRRVFETRLRACRNLYRFMLDTREAG